jgi:NADH-quinone oxidoreductase subunit A
MKLQFLAVFLLLLVAIGFAAFNLIASAVLGRLFANAGTNPLKDSAYECGMPLLSPARMRFSVKFYLVAVLFVLFDIEVVFMYPWALKFADLGWFAFVEMLFFLAILFTGWIYVVRKGALDWGVESR